MNNQNGPNVNSGILNLLKIIANEEGIQQYKITEPHGAVKGDGYLGIISCVEINGISNSETKKLSFIIKAALKSNAFRNNIPLAELFQREAYMYETVIPLLQKFLIDHNLPTFPSFAKFYKATVINNDEALILENLQSRGFKLWERRVPMNEEHVALVMQQYGRFHAVSFAMKDKNPKQFSSLTKGLDDIMAKFLVGFDYHTMMIHECKKVVDKFNTVEHGEAGNIFKRFIETIPDFVKNLSNLSKDHAVILHGDCWSTNMMFQYDEGRNPGKPIQVCFIDLQLSRLASPVLDAAYFFYTCSSKNIVDDFEKYMNIYYNSLAEFVNQLGCNPGKIYPYSIFRQQWKELAKFGLLVSMILIKLMLSEQNEVSDIIEIAESGKPMSDSFIYTIGKSDEYNDRIMHLILHFIKNDFL